MSILFILLLILVNGLYAQQHVIFNVNLPAQLISNAGDDIFIPVGDSNVIGGTPAASGGNPSYTYLWTPGIYLDDSTIANPVAKPLSSVTYYLTVKDMRNCTSTDDIYVHIDSSGITTGPEYGINNSPVIFYSSENNSIHVNFHNQKINEDLLTILITDITGRILLKQSMRYISSFTVKLPEKILPEIIIIKLYSKEMTWSDKFITK